MEGLLGTAGGMRDRFLGMVNSDRSDDALLAAGGMDLVDAYLHHSLRETWALAGAPGETGPWRLPVRDEDPMTCIPLELRLPAVVIAAGTAAAAEHVFGTLVGDREPHLLEAAARMRTAIEALAPYLPPSEGGA